MRHLLAHASGIAFDTTDVIAAPGTRRIYSSAGFDVLADFITEQTGIPFPDYLRESVFEPLGMTATALTGPAGHGARSSVDDLVRFAAELLRPRLISPQTHAEAVTVQFPGLNGVLPGYGSQRPNDWGLGFEIRARKSPHWTGTTNSEACCALADENFGDWAREVWPVLSDAVIAESNTLTR
ncbi:beta-lactamase [Mycobacteroides abscessus subsp. abscessus]|nr:beta-lactamase [Mycobacteroides abscessus subsp. abscessus]